MSDFVEQHILIPRHRRFCSECYTRMPALATIAPLARLAGWSFYGYVWLCRAHKASRNPEIRKRLDDKLATIRAEAATEVARWRAEADREVMRRMGHAPAPDLPQPRRMDPGPAPAAESGAFGQVFVLAEESAFPFAEGLEQKLLRQITQHPRFPLAAGAQITSLRVPELPAEARASLEGVISTLQTRFNRRGGRWQGEFYPTPVGVTFLVVYLE